MSVAKAQRRSSRRRMTGRIQWGRGGTALPGRLFGLGSRDQLDQAWATEFKRRADAGLSRMGNPIQPQQGRGPR